MNLCPMSQVPRHKDPFDHATCNDLRVFHDRLPKSRTSGWKLRDIRDIEDRGARCGLVPVAAQIVQRSGLKFRIYALGIFINHQQHKRDKRHERYERPIDIYILLICHAIYDNLN